jgi:hypothetical protein
MLVAISALLLRIREVLGSNLGQRPTDLMFFVPSLSPSKHILGQDLRIVHGSFLPHPLHSICSFDHAIPYTCAAEKAVK